MRRVKKYILAALLPVLAACSGAPGDYTVSAAPAVAVPSPTANDGGAPLPSWSDNAVLATQDAAPPPDAPTTAPEAAAPTTGPTPPAGCSAWADCVCSGGVCFDAPDAGAAPPPAPPTPDAGAPDAPEECPVVSAATAMTEPADAAYCVPETPWQCYSTLGGQGHRLYCHNINSACPRCDSNGCCGY